MGEGMLYATLGGVAVGVIGSYLLGTDGGEKAIIITLAVVTGYALAKYGGV